MSEYTKTVDPNGGSNYTSLSAWEAGEQTLYSSGDIAIADCKRTGATKDTTALTISGWTTGVIPKIIVNSNYRHEGKWADTRVSDGNRIYILSVSIESGYVLDLNVDNIYVEGLSFENTHADYNYNALNGWNRPTITVKNCIGYRQSGGWTGYNPGIFALSHGKLINCIGINLHASTGSCAFFPWTSAYLYNCTAWSTNGIGIKTDSSTIVKNCASFAGAAAFSGSFDSSSDYNVSSDSTALGTHKATTKTSYSTYFEDYSNGDFHLKDTSYNLWGLAGTSLSGDFTTDIDGETRVNWDIGADEFISDTIDLTLAGLSHVLALENVVLSEITVLLLPISDVSNPGSWTTAPLWSKVVEVDSSFINSPASSTLSSCSFQLDDATDPETDENFSLYIVLKTATE